MPTLKIKPACMWTCLIIIIIAHAWALIICNFEEYIGRIAVQEKMGKITELLMV